ncbi:MAG: hypothetical protein QGD94_04460, partial [Planctomycetia bacterium]|nr:hypothetical protein [Planctomycetia bacterium]
MKKLLLLTLVVALLAMVLEPALGQAPKSMAEGRVSPPKKAGRPAPARRAKARADAPQVVVLVFKQIPAQS